MYENRNAKNRNAVEITTYEKRIYSKEELEDFLVKNFPTELIENIHALFHKYDFVNKPAAQKHHSAYPGGLLDHSMTVALTLQMFTEKMGLKWKRGYSPALIGLLHDMCKCDDYDIEYEASPGDETAGRAELYSDINIIWAPTMPGHGLKSLLMIQGFVDLTDEETNCILFHMGAFTDSSEWHHYTKAVKIYQNVLWTHTADMYASNVCNI